jgi:hypothetical protein
MFSVLHFLTIFFFLNSEEMREKPPLGTKLPSIIINNKPINLDGNALLANAQNILRNQNRISEISKLYKLPKSSILNYL